MSEFNDNKQPRRRRTQLNAAQYAGQQTLDDLRVMSTPGQGTTVRMKKRILTTPIM